MWQVIWGVPGVSGEAYDTPTPLTHLKLPLSKHRWVTAAVILSSQQLPSCCTSNDPIVSGSTSEGDEKCLPTESWWLVCGDRKGSLHVFQASISTEVCMYISQ